jgi:copper chaperone NosL
MILLIASLIALSCATDPEPINWGSDQCEHCRMTLADSKFGAEIVTKKGKTYKFDAVECMLSYLKSGKLQQNEISSYVVVDASNPGAFVNSKKAYYLISENFPSPMGANLSAFGTKTSAESFQKQFTGEIKSWDEIITKFKVK